MFLPLKRQPSPLSLTLPKTVRHMLNPRDRVHNDEQVETQNLVSNEQTQLPLGSRRESAICDGFCADLRVGDAYKSINARVPPEVNCIYVRKRLITAPPPETIPSGRERWLDLERSAVVEVTSEDKGYPIESAFASIEAAGWRAETPGPQTFDSFSTSLKR